jgi:hypothetical protein
MRQQSKLLSVVFAVILVGVSQAAVAQQPEYQTHIDWVLHDSGGPDCPERYFAAGLEGCLALGNRSCIGSIAIEAAYRGQDQVAMYLVSQIGQCHNGEAQGAVEGAGPQAVGNYLRTYQRPAWGPILDLIALYFGS